MEKKAFAVCFVVGFLGLLATVLGFAAEFKRIKVSDVQTKNPGECVYPRSPALALGLASAMALIVAQSIINTVAGCVCCKKHPHPTGSKWTVALLSFVVCWLAFVLAFLLLLTGAALNDQRGEERMYFGNYCYVVRPGVFSGGAVLSFTCVAFGILYYLSVSSAKTVEFRGHQGIVMGHPQIPPQSTQPVFVHEDTYQRQQFP